MKEKIIKKMVIALLISIIIPYIFTTFCYAAKVDKYYQGFKMVKRYGYSLDDVQYWITGLLNAQTEEIKVPSMADDGIAITGIYDNTVTRGVFQGNPWLKTVDLSESKIQLIGVYCFANTNLTNFKNSPCLKEILGYAFQNANLNSITLNEGLETIKISAFEDAFSDENSVYIINIPDSVTTIGENAFKVTNKNYRVVLVGKKGSVAEEYCKTDSKCTFIERGDKIPTEDDLIQEEIKKEKSKLFVNPKFTYYDYNNTDSANITRIFGWPASTLISSNIEDFSDIIEVEDGFIVVGSCYIDKYKNESKYFQESFASKAKGNQDAIIAKYNYDLGMEWFESFGGSLNDQFHKIYKTKDGGYLVSGRTCSNNKDLLNINYDTSNYHNMVVKYDSNFKVVSTKMQETIDESEILEDTKGSISDGEIVLNTISEEGKIGVVTGSKYNEMNALIKKYDSEGHLEWTKTYDKDSNKTNDRLVKAIEVDDGYVFIGNSSKYVQNSYNNEIYVEDAIIVKYNKPYDQILVSAPVIYDMKIGEQRSVNLYYVPWEDVTIGEMQWTSENEQVATVDYKGNILATGEGSTRIELNIRGKTTLVAVNVIDPTIKHIQNIELDKTKITLNKGETQTLVATITPADTTDSKQITWSSNNADIVKVNDEGEITAINYGKATITATSSNGLTAECEVEVNYDKGDVNGDEKVSTLDYGLILSHVMRTQKLEGEMLKRADVNGDEKVSTLDYGLVLSHVMRTALLH